MRHAAIALLLMLGQQSAKPAFEVAAIKRSANLDKGGTLGLLPGGRFRAINFDARTLVSIAYRTRPPRTLTSSQIIGAPDWMSEERYDINAKIGPELAATIDAPNRDPDLMPKLVQSLLEDRFKLKMHYEQRDTPIYALVVARKDGTLGPQLRPTAIDCARDRSKCSISRAAGRFTGGKPPKNALYDYGTAVSELVLFAIILAVVLWIARGLPRREAFALRRPASWGRAAGLGIAVFIVIAVTNAVLNPFLHGGREQGLTPSGWEPQHAVAFALNLVAFALVGPIAEELTFRGLGFFLLEPLGQTAAIVIIGVTFGLWHGLIEALPVLMVFGAGLAYLRSRTDSIYPGIILHAAFNASALLIAVSV
jgi:membrane protease YdiL (CAAX protease family)